MWSGVLVFHSNIYADVTEKVLVPLDERHGDGNKDKDNDNEMKIYDHMKLTTIYYFLLNT